MKQTLSMRGFTMLELTLVILLIATLAFMSYGWYRQEIVKANTAELLTNIDAMRTAFTVEDRAGASIPDFGYGGPGKIPAALSHVAINEDMLQYPNLKLLFSYSYLQNADDHVFLVLASQNERGADTLRALSQELPETHFSWMVKPVAALVPMIGGIHTRHVMSPPNQLKAPKPVTVTQAPTPLATPSPDQGTATPQPAVQQTPQPQVAAVTNPQPSQGGGSATTQASTSGSGSGASSSGSQVAGGSGSTSVRPTYQWIPPGHQHHQNCHGHHSNNGHGHGHAYGHCNH